MIVALAALVGVIALFWFDRSRSDLIAAGVRSGEVDLGGLRAGQARVKLARAVAGSLRRGVMVRRGARRWRLGAHRAALRVDVRGTVDDALARSRSGSILTRTERAISGRPLQLEVPVRVTYSRQAVARLVRQVKRDVDRPARDANVTPSGDRLVRVAAHKGAKVRGPVLHRRVADALSHPARRQPVSVPWTVVRPKVETRDLVAKYRNYIVIERGAFTLRYFHRLKPAKSYTIAVGRQGLETPAGLYDIQGKQVNPSWQVPNSAWAGDLAGQLIPPGPRDPLKARWMGFNGGAGIHGTAENGSLGSAASHGCIRMSIPDVIDLYKRVHVHTPVYVQ